MEVLVEKETISGDEFRKILGQYTKIPEGNYSKWDRETVRRARSSDLALSLQLLCSTAALLRRAVYVCSMQHHRLVCLVREIGLLNCARASVMVGLMHHRLAALEASLVTFRAAVSRARGLAERTCFELSLHFTARMADRAHYFSFNRIQCVEGMRVFM